jgi:uncharacterized protein YbaP (TraB family)
MATDCTTTPATRRRLRRGHRIGALLLVLLAAIAAETAAVAEPAIWSLDGRGGEVLLLGSVHLLRQEDYPLPANVTRAYDAADRLVMELDESALDPMAVQMLLLRIGRLEEGRTLADVMGSRDYRKATEYAQALGYPLELLGPLKPWLAAITVMNLHTVSLGYSPELGLEQHLTGLARRDDKPIAGLETIEFQLELFDGLPEATQSSLLLQTLEEASMMDDQLGQLIGAWRRGDSAALDRELTRSFDDYPEVYRRLVTDRNRDWTRQLEKLAAEDGVTLVVVGALHLVGENSVIRMLRDRGRRVERWRPDD